MKINKIIYISGCITVSESYSGWRTIGSIKDYRFDTEKIGNGSSPTNNAMIIRIKTSGEITIFPNVIGNYYIAACFIE